MLGCMIRNNTRCQTQDATTHDARHKTQDTTDNNTRHNNTRCTTPHTTCNTQHRTTQYKTQNTTHNTQDSPTQDTSTQNLTSHDTTTQDVASKLNQVSDLHTDARCKTQHSTSHALLLRSALHDRGLNQRLRIGGSERLRSESWELAAWPSRGGRAPTGVRFLVLRAARASIASAERTN